MTSFNKFMAWYKEKYPEGPLCEEAINYFKDHYWYIDRGDKCPQVWCYKPKKDRQLAFEIHREYDNDNENR